MKFRVLRTIHYITDVFGARITGSPQLQAAGEWAARQLSDWGAQNAHLEPWNFGRDGWSNERVAAFLVTPVKDTLVAETLAWTPGTNGPVTASCVQIIPPDGPTQAELTAWLGAQSDAVWQEIVLVGKHAYPATPPPSVPAQQGRLSTAQVNVQVDAFLAGRALVRVNDASRPYGQIVAQGSSGTDPSRLPPTLVIRNEDFGRISRLLAEGAEVELDLGIVTTCSPDGEGKWCADYTRLLAGKRVRIVVDRDEKGETHGKVVSEALAGYVSDVKIISLPGLPAKGDLWDWIEAGGTGEQHRAIVENTKAIEPAAEPGEHSRANVAEVERPRPRTAS